MLNTLELPVLKNSHFRQTKAKSLQAPSEIPTDSKGFVFVAICMATFRPDLRLFQKQINSIIAQSHTNWVCMVNDDCSPDDILQQIEKICAVDSRFIVHRNKSNLGFYRNFEAALRLAPDNVDFIAFADQDDVWRPEKLAVSLNAFDDNTVLVYCDCRIVSDSGAVISPTFWRWRRNQWQSLEEMIVSNTVSGAGAVFKSSLKQKLLPFPYMPRAAHDHWLACVALCAGNSNYPGIGTNSRLPSRLRGGLGGGHLSSDQSTHTCQSLIPFMHVGETSNVHSGQRTEGAIKYIDQALYDYIQHGGNAIGHSISLKSLSGRIREKRLRTQIITRTLRERFREADSVCSEP